MDYAAVLADIEARQAKWREWDEENARKQAKFDAEMLTLQLAAQRQSDQIYHAMLYVGFNPHPTPEVFKAILGVNDD